MAPDNELLARWLRTRSEQDFAELVQRHLAMVHSAALRVVNGDRHLADDVAQTVFADLARKARSLTDRPSLAGWLHTSARFAAMGLLRGEHRRRQREQEALSMPQDPAASDAPAWSELQPVIDAAISDLSAKDREALLLRYFENRSHREIGELLGLTDNAARMRVERALDKARSLLAKRGITSSTSGLAAALLAHGTLVTTTVTAAQITTAALTSAAAAGPGFTLLHLMTATQLKTGLAVTALVAGLSVPLALQHRANAELRSQNATLNNQLIRLTELEAENNRLRGLAVADAELATLRLEVQELSRTREQLLSLQEENTKLLEQAQSLQRELAAIQQDKLRREDADWRKEFRNKKSTYIALLTQIVLVYANARDGQLPDSIAELRAYLDNDSLDDPKQEALIRAFQQRESDWGLSLDDLELVTTGNLFDLPDPKSAVLLRDRNPVEMRGGYTLTMQSFSNGSVSANEKAPNGDSRSGSSISIPMTFPGPK